MNRLPAPELPAWLDRLMPFERYRVQVGDYAMHVSETGAGRPVLMLHGNPTWGFLYRKVAAALEGEPLRLIMPDLIGLGFSDKPRRADEHQLEQHGAWLGALIDALDLSDLVFVGQDWGGPIGLKALADRRARLGALVILNTVVGPPRPGFRATTFHRFARLPLVSDVAFRVLGFPQAMLGSVQGDKRSISGEVARAYGYPLRRLRDRVAPLALARMVPDSLEHRSVPALRVCREFVESFGGPSAVVWGERDPILGRARRAVERSLPKAEVTLTQAGHFLQEEVPDEIARAIRRVCAG
jgi:cis-3-alkyl-4-acyloxetan-2-one decarboxylase